MTPKTVLDRDKTYIAVVELNPNWLKAFPSGSPGTVSQRLLPPARHRTFGSQLPAECFDVQNSCLTSQMAITEIARPPLCGFICSLAAVSILLVCVLLSMLPVNVIPGIPGAASPGALHALHVRYSSSRHYPSGDLYTSTESFIFASNRTR